MSLPWLTYYGNTLDYDRQRGVLRVLDWRAYPQQTNVAEYADVDAVARVIMAGDVPDLRSLALLAGYGLALVARDWKGRPSDAQRGALIQAAERLAGGLAFEGARRSLEHCLARADAAIVDGGDAETVVADYVDGEVRRADKAAERCGRRAAEILTDGDAILTHGYAGPALNWMLYAAAVEQKKQLRVYATLTWPKQLGARVTAPQALEIGVPVTLLADSTPGLCFARGLIGVYMTGAGRIALDGSVVNTVGTYQYAVLARHQHVPFYVLGGDGPDPAMPSGADTAIVEGHPAELQASGGAGSIPSEAVAYTPYFDVTPPELVSAIITDRGVYRAEMIARYLDDNDAPLDVIPLVGG